MQYNFVTFRKDADRHSINPTPYNTLAGVESAIHNIVLHGPNRDRIGFMVLASDGAVYYYDTDGIKLREYTKPWA